MRKSDILTSFYFIFLNCVCGSRNLRLGIFAVNLWKLGFAVQFSEYKCGIESLYRRILCENLPTVGFQDQPTVSEAKCASVEFSQKDVASFGKSEI